jgi:HTH-type transcriptional regulator / antitoxin HipB
MAMDYTVRTRDQLKTLLVAFRKAGKQTQAELAASLGVTQQALSALEGAPSSASFERILNLLSALNVDVVLRTREQVQKIPPVLAREPDMATVQRDRLHRLFTENRHKPLKPAKPIIPVLGEQTSTEKTAKDQTKPRLPMRKRDEW